MDMVLQKETLTTHTVTCKRQTEVTVESDIIVPDKKPDMGKILEADGRAQITDCRVQGDRVLVSGTARFCILYVPEEAEGGMLESMHLELPFKDVCTGIDTENGISAQAEIGEIKAVLLNSRKLSLRGVVILQLCTEAENTVALAVGAEGDPQMKTKTIWVQNAVTTGQFRTQIGSTEEVPGENPALLNLLKTEAQIMEEDVKLITGKMIVKGTVRVRTLYTGDIQGGPPCLMEHALPFTEILDLPGAEEHMEYTLDSTVGDIYCEKDPDDEENRRFGIEVTLEMRATVMQKGEISILEDCFYPGMETTLRKETVALMTEGTGAKETLALRGTVSLPEGLPPILAVCTLWAKPSVRSVTVDNGKAEVEGETEVTILYQTEEGEYPVESYQDKIPFSFSSPTAASEESALSCRVRLLDASCTLTDGETVEVRVHLDFDLRYTEEKPVETISAISAEEKAGEEKPSVVIAFPAPGDTLWDMGKRYGVELEKIARANHMRVEEALTPGERLLVP